MHTIVDLNWVGNIGKSIVLTNLRHKGGQKIKEEDKIDESVNANHYIAPSLKNSRYLLCVESLYRKSVSASMAEVLLPLKIIFSGI